MTSDDERLVFGEKLDCSQVIELDGMTLELKLLESYEEYLEARPLVETLSRCSTWHSRDYVEAMLRLPSYYPFIVKTLESKESELTADAFNDIREVDATSEGAIGTDTTAEPNATQLPHKARIVGYMEIYVLPHLGRLCDSRLERVIVDSLYRNRGICQMMLNFVIGFCKEKLHCNRIDLICDNPVAMAIYNKFGFEPVNSKIFRRTL